MKILILEDDPMRQRSFLFNLVGHSVEIVDQSAAAIAKLENESWDCLFLDHDLEGKVYCTGPNTGYAVAVWLEEHPEKKPVLIFTHSYNLAGVKNILQALPGAMYFPSCWLYADLTTMVNSFHRCATTGET